MITSAKQLLDEIKSDVAEAKNRGNAEIKISNLERYLADLSTEIDRPEASTSDTRPSHATLAELQHQSDLAEYHLDFEANREMFKSTIVFGQSALRSSILINGGGTIALLAFVGNIWGSKTDPDVFAALIAALFSFTIGVLLSAISHGCAYVMQFLGSQEWVKTAHIFQVAAIALVVGAYCAFGWGAYVVYDALKAGALPH